MSNINSNSLNRRQFLRVAGGVSAAGVLAACAPATEAPKVEPTAAPAAEKGSGEVVIVVGGWAEESTKKVAEKIGFLDSGYTLNVQLLPSGPELTTALTGGIASGKSPYDVMDFEDGQAIQYSRSGYFEALDDLLEPDFWDDFPPNLMDMAKTWDQYEGKTFRIHHCFEAQYSWYRKDWFDKMGVKPPTTWDEVSALGKAFTDESNGVWAVEEGLQVMSVYLGYITSQAGGNYFNVDDKMETALQYIYDLMYEHKAMNPACLQKNYDQQNADYTSDKVAYHRQWPFFYDVARAKEDWFSEDKAAICLPPVGPGGKAMSTYAAGWGYGILKSAPNSEGAKTLLKLLVDKKNAGQMALIDTWYLINRKSVMETVGDKGMAKYLKMYSDAGVLAVRPFHEKYGEATVKLDEAAIAYLTKQISLDEAMKQAQDTMAALNV